VRRIPDVTTRTDTPAAAAADAVAQAIAALEAQRGLLGDAAVDAALAPLRAALGGTQTLRQVSVVFLDVVGSTALSQQLDPEDMSTVMDELLAACTTIVKQHGGRVLQYAGDSLLAVFGADGAREDDAERAVHCALALVDEGAVRAVLTLETHGHAGLHVRVGVHTGPVLLGGGVAEDASIRGHTVHVAARMEQTAPRGRVRISHDTWQQVRGVFDVQVQPPMQIKGQDAPIATWLVIKAKPRAFRVPARGIEGSETALVGRSAELAQLLEGFETVCRTRAVCSVTLLGDAGVGKSRLVHELQHRLDRDERDFWLLLGRAMPSTRLQPYGLLRNVVAWRLQIADSDPAALARSRLVDGLLPLLAGDGVGTDEATAQAEALGQLLGMDFSASPRLAALLNDSRALRDRALAALARVLRRLAASDGSPIVMLLDDLQWADDASLDALWWLRGQAGLPLLQVCTARPEFAERRPAWATPEPADERHPALRLPPLGGPECRLLTRSLLARLAVPSPALEAMIEKQAEGNPFYAEELIKMLIDDGVIVVDAEHASWRLAEDRLVSARIPLTLTGVLQARLDGLATTERRALQRASVVGPVFWDAALGQLDPAAPGLLPAVQQRGMISGHAESAFQDTREFGFQHHLLHQVTYDTVLKADKRSGHAAAAAWLAARVGDREAEYLAVTAEHYERAGDREQALRWFKRAEEAASDRHANQVALDFVSRMLALVDPADIEMRCWLHQQQRELGDLTGQRDLQRQASDALEALAEAAGRIDWLAGVAANRALLYDRIGDREASREQAERGARLAEESGDGSAGVLSEGQLAWLARERGDFARAQQHLDRAFAWCARAEAQWPNRRRPFVYDIQLRLVAAQQCLSEDDLDGGLGQAEEALALSLDRRIDRLVYFSHDTAGVACRHLLRIEQAVQHIDLAEAAAQRVGMPMNVILCAVEHARLQIAIGNPDGAVPQARTAIEQLEALKAHGSAADARLVLAQALLMQGQPAQAVPVLREALTYLDRGGSATEQRNGRALLALALARQGALAEARDLIEANLADLAHPKAFGGIPPQVGRFAVWQTLVLLGDARAAEHLTLGRAELERRFAKVGNQAEARRIIEAWSDGNGLRLSPRPSVAQMS
jgi:class 3 adenylate cyclase/tetratricopeptide (TPR) repeat protein